MPITFTDAEQRFADSARGQMLVARARHQYEMGEAYKGANARPWTDAMHAAAVRTLTTHEARDAVSTAAFMADSARQEPIARAIRDTAHAMREDEIRNAWRGK